MPSRRTVFYALLALLVPLPAFALDGGGVPERGVVALSVSASLGGCGVAGPSVVCEIDASWGAVEGADYYTASVRSPNGSVVDYGQTSGSGAALWVPYAGAGTYSVSVAAWGEGPDDRRPHLIARDTAHPSRDAQTVDPDNAKDTLLAPQGEADGGGSDGRATDDPSTAEPVDPAVEPADPADTGCDPPAESPLTGDPAAPAAPADRAAVAEAPAPAIVADQLPSPADDEDAGGADCP